MLWLLKLSFASLITHDDNVKIGGENYKVFRIETVCPKILAVTTAQNITNSAMEETGIYCVVQQRSSAPLLDMAFI